METKNEKKLIDITYDGYLIEKKLGKVIEFAFSTMIDSEIKPQYRIGNQRCDFAILRTKSHDLAVIYEFDGPQHYQSSYTFELDREKDKLAHERGVPVIRIPYFVQLCKEMLEYYFPGRNLTSEVKYPHGFISKKAPLPTTFTDRGLAYYCWQLQKMPRSISNQIWKSMIDRGVDPTKLAYLPMFIFKDMCEEIHGDRDKVKEDGDVVCMLS